MEAEINDFWNTWDKAIQHFKNIAICCTTINNKIKCNDKLQLTCRLNQLHARASSGLAHDIENYFSAKEKLKQFELEEWESIQLRSKACFLEKGECSTRYFHSLEKKQKADQTIRLLTKDNLDTISTPYELLQETHHFYQSLYSAEPHDNDACNDFLTFNTPTLSLADRNCCEGPLNPLSPMPDVTGRAKTHPDFPCRP